MGPTMSSLTYELLQVTQVAICLSVRVQRVQNMSTMVKVALLVSSDFILFYEDQFLKNQICEKGVKHIFILTRNQKIKSRTTNIMVFSKGQLKLGLKKVLQWLFKRSQCD